MAALAALSVPVKKNKNIFWPVPGFGLGGLLWGLELFSPSFILLGNLGLKLCRKRTIRKASIIVLSVSLSYLILLMLLVATDLINFGE